MAEKLSKKYLPQQIEKEIYKKWETSGYFNPDNLKNSSQEKTFSVPMAPVNITGNLHIGHALENSLVDVLVRRKRMQGFKTLWVPGTDHAGIATQVKVEQKLLKEGQSRHDLGKDKFIEKVWDWKKQYGRIILEQFKRLGISCDWSRERFTLDKGYDKAVKTAFKHYYEKGWIYKGDRLINWCPGCETALSDLELEYKEFQGKLWYIKYPLKDSHDSVVIATTRPETMLGDTAVAVHPSDERYKNLVGRKVILPLAKREIPIIADYRVDKEFGTGALKITPAHDKNDWEIGREHKLKVIQVIDAHGLMTQEAGIYQGLTIRTARQKILEELKKQKLLEKEEVYPVKRALCYRCNTPIEPLVSQQWFLKMDDLAEKAKKAVKEGKVKIVPRRWEKPYLEWLDNINDWCISRQIWWGHKIPLEKEEDVLDTWFSSALWPFASLGWPESCQDLKQGVCHAPQKDLAQYYPADLITSAKGILYLWQVRMIFSGMEFMEKPPFKTIYIHPMVLTKGGKRMSKSLGTGIDPLNLIDKYGADATRFGLLWQTGTNQSLRFSEDNVIMGQKFANKLWNATRFILMKELPEISAATLEKDFLKRTNLQKDDKAIIDEMQHVIEAVDRSLDQFRFDKASEVLYEFFWHRFCDVCLEKNKERIFQDENSQARERAQRLLVYILLTSLKLFHPFMPFVTEEIYQKLPLKDKKDFLMIEDWPLSE